MTDGDEDSARGGLGTAVAKWFVDVARGTGELLAYAAQSTWQAFVKIHGPRGLARFIVMIVLALRTVALVVFLGILLAGALTLLLEWLFGLTPEFGYWLGWALLPPSMVALFYFLVWLGGRA